MTAYEVTEDNAPLVETITKSRAKRVLLVVCGMCALAAAVFGIVYGVTHASSGGSSSEATRPSFAAVFECLSGVPAPTIHNETNTTITASLSFVNTTISPSGRLMHANFTYHVTMVKNVVASSDVEELQAIACSADNLVLTFDTSAHAIAFAQSWGNNTLFLVRQEFASCSEEVRRFSSIPQQSPKFPNRLIVSTRNASMVEMFENAFVHFFSNHTSENAVPDTSSPAVPTSNSRARRGLFGSIESGFDDLTDASEDVVSVVANDAVAVAGKVITVAQSAFEGDLSASFAPQPYLYTYPTQTEVIPMLAHDSAGYSYSLNATAEYGGQFTFGTQLAFQVEDYTLQHFSALATGDLMLHLGLGLQGEFYASKRAQKNLLHTNLFSATIPIGAVLIPFTMKLNLTGGLGFAAEAGLDVSATARAFGSATVGIVYDEENGLQPSSATSFTHSFALDNSSNINVEAVVTASLSAKLYMQCAFIGGPTVTFNTIAILDADFVDDFETTGSCLTFTEQLQAQVFAGGTFQIDIDGYKSGAHSLAPLCMFNRTLWHDEQQLFCQQQATTQGAKPDVSTQPISSEAATSVVPATSAGSATSAGPAAQTSDNTPQTTEDAQTTAADVATTPEV